MTDRIAKIIKEQQAKLRAGLADYFYDNSEPRIDGSRFQRLRVDSFKDRLNNDSAGRPEEQRSLPTL